MRASLVLAVVLTSAACTRGPSVETLPHATNPIGAQAKFSVRGAKMQAELIAVQDSGYVFRDGANRLVFAPFAAVANLRVPTVRGAVSGAPSQAGRRALRLASRYPQGVTPEILRALLSQRSQAALHPLE